jgi:hypothetical protein
VLARTEESEETLETRVRKIDMQYVKKTKATHVPHERETQLKNGQTTCTAFVGTLRVANMNKREYHD